jgi:hypothetical protein
MSKLKTRTCMLLLALLGFPAGCATQSPPDPSLYSVCLDAEGPCVSDAYAGERTEVALIGEHFHPAFEVDIGSDEPPPVRGAYRAFIANTPLDDVRRGTDTLLLGTLPGTVPLGAHDVIAEIPGGLRAGLPQAFFIVDPLAVTAAPEPPRVPQGHAFGLEVTLQNLGTALLTNITLRLSQEGAGRVLLPADSVLASLGGESSLTATLPLKAQQPGQASLLLGVSALAGGFVRVGPREPLAIDILVLPPADLVVSANVAPTTVEPGDRFELIVTVFNTGGVEALDVEVLTPGIGGSGSVVLDSPAPSGLNVPAGSRQAILWGGQALTRGTVVFHAQVHGLEAISERLLGPVDADPVSLEIR